jgi:phage repressor protein C with HTH and peptisase S24 domain
MLRHTDIWRAIDELAARYKLSPSALAKKAGLDPTTFNKSKRQGPDGRLRWPSTESVSKILKATGAGLDEFFAILAGSGGARTMQRVPVIGYAQAGEKGYFDDAGFPAGSGWDELAFPDLGDPNAYALEISGDSMSPVYRDGDRIIVSPNSPIRRGDRIVVKTTEDEVMAKQLARQTATRVELYSVNELHAHRELTLGQIAWMHRILWVSQ